jgi:uncharacterized protein YdbL (DUF1318 family)
MKTRNILLLILTLCAGSAWSQYKNTLAVLDIRAGQGVDQQLVPLINEYFGTAVGNKGEYYVVSGQPLQARLKEIKDVDAANCASVGCLVKMGKALGVQKVLSGEISATGKEYTITLKLVDVPNGKLAAAVNERYTMDATRLVEQLDQYVVNLFAREKEAQAQAQQVAVDRQAFRQKLFSPSTASTNHVQVLAGQRFHGTDGIIYNDYIKLNLKFKRHNIGVDFMPVTKTTLKDWRSTAGDTSETEKVEFGGLGLVYGYEAWQFFDGWLRITPGVTAGAYEYKYSKKIIVDPDGARILVLDVPTTINGNIGAMLGVDIGKQFTKWFGVFIYGQTKVLYRQEIMVLVDYGLKFSF